MSNLTTAEFDDWENIEEDKILSNYITNTDTIINSVGKDTLKKLNDEYIGKLTILKLTNQNLKIDNMNKNALIYDLELKIQNLERDKYEAEDKVMFMELDIKNYKTREQELKSIISNNQRITSNVYAKCASLLQRNQDMSDYAAENSVKIECLKSRIKELESMLKQIAILI